MNLVHREIVKYVGSDLTATALTTTSGQAGDGIHNCDKMHIHFSDGYATLLLKTDASVDLAYQVSDTGNADDFHTPYDTDGTDLGAIVSALGANRWIYISPVPAEWMRIVLTVNSNATVSLSYSQRETKHS